MKVGEFNTMVYVEQSETTRGGKGQVINGWTAFTTFWAKVEHYTSEDEGQQGTNDVNNISVSTHYLQTITTAMRLKVDGNYYNIKRITREGNAFMTIEAYGV